MDDKKYFTFRISKGVLVYILIMICVFGGMTAYNNWPRYIVLNPPIPNGALAMGEYKTVYITYDGGKATKEKLWVWRKTYMFLPILRENFDTADSIIAYFDKWLNEQGWKRFEEVGFPCGGMIEAEFLNRGENLFAYVPKDARNSYSSPAVCLAIWPFTTADDSVGFDVLLFSETP